MTEADQKKFEFIGLITPRARVMSSVLHEKKLAGDRSRQLARSIDVVEAMLVACYGMDDDGAYRLLSKFEEIERELLSCNKKMYG